MTLPYGRKFDGHPVLAHRTIPRHFIYPFVHDMKRQKPGRDGASRPGFVSGKRGVRTGDSFGDVAVFVAGKGDFHGDIQNQQLRQLVGDRNDRSSAPASAAEQGTATQRNSIAHTKNVQSFFVMVPPVLWHWIHR